MNSQKVIAFTLPLLFLISPSVMALPDGNVPPSMVDMSASFAKARAKLRAYDHDLRDPGLDNDDIFALGEFDTEGCDVNIGNIVLDDTAPDAPDDVIIFVQGDIIQANNCR